ncbi:hypothetical protein MIR68_000946 [Amoeboaphelidium protococcarum]|nr:hypothetical protein MIR68_000946 [Amoeboaphelidium protococcarum]
MTVIEMSKVNQSKQSKRKGAQKSVVQPQKQSQSSPAQSSQESNESIVNYIYEEGYVKQQWTNFTLVLNGLSIPMHKLLASRSPFIRKYLSANESRDGDSRSLLVLDYYSPPPTDAHAVSSEPPLGVSDTMSAVKNIIVDWLYKALLPSEMTLRVALEVQSVASYLELQELADCSLQYIRVDTLDDFKLLSDFMLNSEHLHSIADVLSVKCSEYLLSTYPQSIGCLQKDIVKDQWRLKLSDADQWIQVLASLPHSYLAQLMEQAEWIINEYDKFFLFQKVLQTRSSDQVMDDNRGEIMVLEFQDGIGKLKLRQQQTSSGEVN